jgi:hypothetical protein
MKIPTLKLMDVSYALRRSSAGTFGTESDRSDNNPDIKRLQSLQEGLQRLQSMANPKQLAKQDSANRVGFLQRRLEALKMMLLHASPEQAKTLARELKSIAGELSSAAKVLGGSAGTVGQGVQTDAASISSTTNAQSVSAESETTTISAEAARSEVELETAPPENNAEQFSDAEQKTEPKSADALGSNGISKSSQNNSASDEIDSAVLRGLVMDAKKMLKEVINMLKPKLAEADKEGKKDLLDAEKKLSEVDTTLQQSAPTDVYSGFNGVSLDVGSSSSAAVAGVNINVTA